MTDILEFSMKPAVGSLYVIVRRQKMKREMFCVTLLHLNYNMKIIGGGEEGHKRGKDSVFFFIFAEGRIGPLILVSSQR